MEIIRTQCYNYCDHRMFHVLEDNSSSVSQVSAYLLSKVLTVLCFQLLSQGC